MNYPSNPNGSSMVASAAYRHPLVAVDAEWVRRHGSRAQRRRIERELKNLVAAKSRRWRDGK